VGISGWPTYTSIYFNTSQTENEKSNTYLWKQKKRYKKKQVTTSGVPNLGNKTTSKAEKDTEDPTE
jgi:hypothetical protein